MKKSLLALAVAGAFTGAAFAQSSVTLYGRVDVGLQKVNKSSTDPNTGAANSSLSGAVANDAWNVVQGSGSRLGFQGTEDLGGGWKAIYQIEHRFTPDDGNTTATPFWAGRSYVGLASGAGTLKLGRDYTPAFWVGITADPWGYDTVAQVGVGPTIPGSPVRFANIIDYKSPTWGGFNFELAYVPSEVASGASGVDVGDKDGFGGNVVWSNGPIYVGFGIERPVKASATAAEITLSTLTGKFKFGMFGVYANIAASKSETTTAAGVLTTETKTGGTSLGFTADVGAGQIRAMISQVKTDGTVTAGVASNNETKTRKMGLGYHHNLSKRTTLYADIANAKTTDNIASTPSFGTRTGFDLGIKHNF
jgi:predicted porin